MLAALLERPGELVAREELKKRLWPSDTFVDFDHSLNKAVNRLREALHDSAEKRPLRGDDNAAGLPPDRIGRVD